MYIYIYIYIYIHITGSTLCLSRLDKLSHSLSTSRLSIPWESTIQRGRKKRYDVCHDRNMDLSRIIPFSFILCFVLFLFFDFYDLKKIDWFLRSECRVLFIDVFQNFLPEENSLSQTNSQIPHHWVRITEEDLRDISWAPIPESYIQIFANTFIDWYSFGSSVAKDYIWTTSRKKHNRDQFALGNLVSCLKGSDTFRDLIVQGFRCQDSELLSYTRDIHDTDYSTSESPIYEHSKILTYRVKGKEIRET